MNILSIFAAAGIAISMWLSPAAVRGQPVSLDSSTIEEGYLPGAAGAELYYRVLGSGRDTIVAVHGGPGAGMHAILPHVRPLARTNAVIFYDQRGGGRSTLPADTAALHARYFVEDLESVRKYFSLKRVSVLAHSFGAVLVARYAQNYPERVERIALIGATGPVREDAATSARKRYAETDSTALRRMQEVLQPLLTGTARDPAAACRAYEAFSDSLSAAPGKPNSWEGTTCESPAEAIRYYYRYTAQITPRTFGDWNYTGGLGHIKAPVLVLHGGSLDRESRLQQQDWARAFPNGRVLVIRGAGKGAIAARPAVALPALDAFFHGEWPEHAAVP